MSGLPLLFNAAGPVTTPPATLREALIDSVAAEVPGYTAILPGSLVDDVAGTDVGALIAIDQARVDAVNSVTPYAANPYLLAQLGQQFGLPQGLGANGSVYLVFTGSAGYVIPPGFLVSDGTNQYVIQDGGTIATGGTSSPLYAVATNSNIFAIPAGSVTQVITSVPSPYTLTVTNPLAGTPAQAPETVESYRSRLLTAYQVAISGTPAYLKTLLLAVPGVSPRLVAVLQNGTLWEVICGGGDPYQVAGAIYAGASSVGLLTGSATTARNVTVSIYDAPDTYSVVYVNPPVQAVTLAVTWNTTQPNFVSGSAVDQYIIGAGLSYINGIVVGQPINLLVLQEQIQAAVALVLSAPNLTTLEFAVTVNGVVATPTAGTSIIPSDPESSFAAAATAVTSVQG
ncbi:MAG: baseplate J/gp47 family protein [Gammaproteobacteria bacterium]